jgi:hypothetical protein
LSEPVAGPRTALLVVPIPHRENHSLKSGDDKIGVQIEASEELPAAAGIAPVAGGGPALVARMSVPNSASEMPQYSAMTTKYVFF